jgi:CspA family cold shock protein
MSSYKDVVTPSASVPRLIGRVKWFNNKAGYGFITVTDGDRSGTDVFVHHSAIMVENQQYKYLVQGEYVEFSDVAATSGPHEYQASGVAGVKGGKLMCETRRDFKIARSTYKTVTSEEEVKVSPLETESTAPVRRPRQPRQPREHLNVSPQGEDGDKKEWTLVKKSTKPPSGATRAPRKQAASVATESK